MQLHGNGPSGANGAGSLAGGYAALPGNGMCGVFFRGGESCGELWEDGGNENRRYGHVKTFYGNELSGEFETGFLADGHARHGRAVSFRVGESLGENECEL